MRVCFVSLAFSPGVGGTQARAEKQARQLLSLGHDVTVVTSRLQRGWKRVEVLDGLPVVRVGGIYKQDGYLRLGRIGYLPVALAMFFTLWRLRSRYDVIHVFDVSQLTIAAVIIGKLTGKPVIVSIQNTGPSDEQRARLEHGAMLMAGTLNDADFLKVDAEDWLIQTGDLASLPRIFLGGQIMLNLLLKSRAIFQCLSKRSRAYLIAQGVRPEQIVLIPGSVDTEKFRPAGHPFVETQMERSIICVARLEYSKGIDVLLHAWACIMRGSSEWGVQLKPCLRLVGEGTLRPQLERLAVELGIWDSVDFLGERSDVVDLLQQSWGFVLPSRWEGMPNALLEAMACGLPCVATRISGSEDAIVDSSNGLLVEPEQPAELAHALVRVMKDEGLTQRLGQEARATVVRDYQLSGIVERCLALYQILLPRNLFSCGGRRLSSFKLLNRLPPHNNNSEPRSGEESEGAASGFRICIAISTLQPIVGGAERQAVAHGRSLRKEGYDATIMTFRHDWTWPEREVIEGVPVRRVAGMVLGKRKQLPRLLQRMLYPIALLIMGWRLWQQRHHYDIVHVYQLNLTVLPAALACWLARKPMVVSVRCADAGKKAAPRDDAALLVGSLDPAPQWLHVGRIASPEGDLYDIERLGELVARLTHALLQHIQVGVIILSSYMQSYLAARRFTFANVQLIPNGVDIQRFAPAGADTLSNERAHIVLCAARLTFQKGIDVLLQAWRLVQQQCPQARLIIAGTGPLQCQLERLAQALGLAESVEFVGLQHDMLAQVQRAGIFISPSRWEGMSNALLEAMACGLACVATRVSGSEDIIIPGINGLLVESEDYQEMALALLALLQDPVLAQQYGQAARSTVEQHYSLEHATNSYINFYHKVVKQRRLPAKAPTRGASTLG